MWTRQLYTRGFHALAILSLSASLQSAQADNFAFATDHSYEIDLSTASIPQKSGSSATISGTIFVIAKNGFTAAPGSKRIENQITKDTLGLHAYFPDMNTEVTSQLQLVETAAGLVITYKTPNLNAGDLNTLIVQVSHPSTQTSQLQLLDTKLRGEILVLHQQIQSDRQNRVDKSVIEALEAEKAQLKETDAQVRSQIEAAFTIAAETDFPLQVDNETAQSSLKTVINEPFLYSIQYDLGSAIAGESANVTGLIEVDPSAAALLGTDTYTPQFLWDNNLVNSASPAPITASSPATFSYSTGKLIPQIGGLFQATWTAPRTLDRFA